MLDYNAMYRGDTELEKLYLGITAVWEKPSPAPAYDETKVAVILLDENDEPTDTVVYFNAPDESQSGAYNHSGMYYYLTGRPDEERYWVRYGSRCGATKIRDYEYYVGSGSTYLKTLKKVTLNEGMTEVGMNGFWLCTNLTSIEFPSSMRTLNAASFYGAESLPEVTFNNGLSVIHSQTFYAARTLTHITIPSSVTEIYNAPAYSRTSAPFYGCTNLTQITVQKPQDSISGAPWGATNATVTWTG